MCEVCPISKHELYKRTGWWSIRCEELIRKLNNVGLVIVEKDKLLDYMIRMEDGGK